MSQGHVILAKLLPHNMSLGPALTIPYINSSLLLMISWWNSSNILDFKLFAMLWILYSFFWVIPQCLNFMCQHFGMLFSIFIGLVNKKNDWDENARVFIRIKVWLKSNLGLSEGKGWGSFSLTYLSYYRSPLGAIALHSLSLYSGMPPPYPSSFKLIQTSFEPNHCLYKYRSNLVPVILLVHMIYEERTDSVFWNIGT